MGGLFGGYGRIQKNPEESRRAPILSMKKKPKDAFLYNLSVLNAVVNELREAPKETPKETGETALIEKIEFPKEGGVLMYMKGFKYPYRGFPFYEFVEKLDIIKKILKGFLGRVHYHLRTNRRRIFTLIPSMWFLKRIAFSLLYSFYRVIERFRIKPHRYCKAVREIYRVFNIMIEREKNPEMRDKIRQLRDFICMFLEFDNAYRFRLQDIIEEVNIDEIKLTKEDKLFCRLRKDYNFGFVQREKGQKQKE